MSLRASVSTGSKSWLFGGMVRHCGIRSDLFIISAVSGACAIQIGVTVSIKVAKLGASRDPTEQTSPSFWWSAVV